MTAAGILLAAGGGVRMGEPKALLLHADGRRWVETSLLALLEGGCDPVGVVVGAQAEAVRAVMAADAYRSVTVLENARWPAGMGGSLRLALDWCSELDPSVTAAVVMLVDTPGVGAVVVRRLLGLGGDAAVLARASYGGDPHDHPVLLGRQHWPALRETCAGQHGARGYLERHRPRLIDCTGLGTGADVDSGSDLVQTWAAQHPAEP